MAIQFLNNVNADNGVLYVDAVNNEVGIGTTSPESILHVVDSAPILKLQSSVSSAPSTISFDNSLGTQEGSLIHNSGSNTFRLNNVSGNSRLNLDSFSATFSVGSSNTDQSGVILDATTVTLKSNYNSTLTCNNQGYVGIGTTSPTEKLFVNGGNAKIETTGTTYLKLNSNTSFPSVQIQAERQGGTSPPLGQLRWDSNPGATGMQLVYWNGYTENSLKLDGSNFKVINNGSERMRIDSSGNVGIGTTSPASQLGSTKVLDISSTGNGEVILDHTDAGVSSDIGLYSWNRNNDHLAHIKATCDGATDSAFISFHAQPTGGSFSNAASNEKMRIKSNGDVGIGTTSPGYTLDVSGDGNFNGDEFIVRNAATMSGGIAGFFENTKDAIHLGDFSGFYAGAKLNIQYKNQVAEFFKMRVGIGIAAPQSSLQVDGGVQLANDADSPSASKVGTFRYYTSGNNSYVDMCMQTGAATYAWVNIVTNSW